MRTYNIMTHKHISDYNGRPATIFCSSVVAFGTMQIQSETIKMKVTIKYAKLQSATTRPTDILTLNDSPAHHFTLVTRRPYCPGRPIELCFTTLSLAMETMGMRLSVVKQSFFGPPGQYGRLATRANSCQRDRSS